MATMLTRKQLLKRTLTYCDDDAAEYIENTSEVHSSTAGGFFQYVVNAFSGKNGTGLSRAIQDQSPIDFDQEEKHQDADSDQETRINTCGAIDDIKHRMDCNHPTSSPNTQISRMHGAIVDSSDSDDDDDSYDGEVVMMHDDPENVEVTILNEDKTLLNKENEEVDREEMDHLSEFSKTGKNILSGMRDGDGSTPKQLRSALSMADLRNAYQERKKKTMRFSSTVHVCLVPTRVEMRYIFNELYFRAEDFAQFKREAVMELREVLTRLGITSKQAIKLMYQPTSEDTCTAPLAESTITKYNYSTVQEGPSLSDDEDASSKKDGRYSHDRKQQKIRRIEEEMDTNTDSDSNHSDHGDESQAKNRDIINSMGNFEIISGNDEGPSLSDDEEESRKYEESVNNKLMTSAPFLTGAKTDVELNMSNTSVQSSDNIHLPSKTPSGGGARAHSGEKHMWEVAWKKSLNQKDRKSVV